MKKSTIITLVVVGVLVLWGISAYNSLVQGEETVETAWGNVESQYQRRADLIPNLVNTVKGYASHESGTLEAVMNARANATKISIDAANATPEQLAAYQKAQGELGQALGRLMAVAENYPELKANENFMQLQSQLEGTENRINVERQNFNNAAKEFNVEVRSFPKNIIANIGGFSKKNYFEADADAKNSPKVEF